MSNLNPQSYSFNLAQNIVYKIHPASNYPTYCSGTTTLTTNQGSFTDGSGAFNEYGNNSDCSWIIAPADTVSSITLSFREFNTQSDDYVTVYDGATTSDPVIGNFSGSSIPSSVTGTKSVMLVKFVSGASGTASGFKAEYKATLANFCNGTTTLNASSGSFNDGSNGRKYHGGSSCRWKIAPTGNVNSINVHFNDFDVASCDNVKIYSGSTLAYTLTGSTIPADMVFSSKVFTIQFITSASSPTANGWSLNYSTSSSVEEISNGINNISVFPNPAKDFINISFNTEKNKDVNLQIFNFTGQLVFNKDFYFNSDIFNESINVSELSKGVYFLNIKSSTGIATKKLIIE